MSFKITGVPAFILAVLVAAFFIYNLFIADRTASAELVKLVKQQIEFNIASEKLGTQKYKDMKDFEEKKALAEETLALLKSIKVSNVKKLKRGERVYVRADVNVSGTQFEKYYIFRYSLITGYTFDREITKYSFKSSTFWLL